MMRTPAFLTSPNAEVVAQEQVASPRGPEAAARRSRSWLIPVLLLAVYAGQCLWFVGTQSFTYDEPVHLLAGMHAWQGRFDVSTDHPPLARLLFTLPLLRHGLSVPEPMSIPGMRSDPKGVGWRTRPVIVALGVLLGLLLWLAARRFFSEPAANFALGLFAFSPGMIAHFSLVTTDGIGILTIFATAFQYILWRHEPSRRNTVLLGLVLGALLLAKLYTLPIGVVALSLMLILRRDHLALRPRDWNWRPAMAAAAIAVVMVCGIYRFHLTRFRFCDGVLTAFIPGRELPIVTAVSIPGNFNLFLPAGEYGGGLYDFNTHDTRGHAAYMLGRTSWSGFRFYWPLVIALKWPVIVLLLCAVALGLVATGRLHLPRDLLVISIFPLMMAALLLFSRIEIGERHALTTYPFVLLLLAGVWQAATRPRLKAALVLLVVLQAADTLRIAPDYLSYFNFWVRPNEAYTLVSDSNLDWGQGLIALHDWQTRHPQRALRLAYFGTVDPRLYGVEAQPLLPGERASGAIAVSMTAMTGQYLKDPDAYKWLLQYPREIVNHSMFIFDVPASHSQ